MNKYFYSLIILLVYFIISFSFLLYEWIEHFNSSKNLSLLIKKNSSIESSLYSAINIYDFMVFHNYTIDELAKTVFYQADKNENNKYTLLKSFYEDLTYAFNKKKEIVKLKNIYSDIIDPLNFTCEELFNISENRLDFFKENPINKQNENIVQSLINICTNLRIDESHEIIASFEYFFQNVKNEIININDFSKEGLIKQIKTGALGRVTAFFDCILFYVIHLANNLPQKNAIDREYYIVNFKMAVTAIIYVVIDFLIIVIVFVLYIFFVNSYCNQIFLLKKTFTIYEIQEQ